MKPTDFQRWLTQADELTPIQMERTLETLTSQNPERACAEVIEEWVADDRRCPRCDMPGTAWLTTFIGTLATIADEPSMC